MGKGTSAVTDGCGRWIDFAPMRAFDRMEPRLAPALADGDLVPLAPGVGLAVRVLEEAAEVVSAWKAYSRCGGDGTTRSLLEDSVADTLQVLANLVVAEGLDMGRAMGDCMARNERLGHFASINAEDADGRSGSEAVSEPSDRPVSSSPASPAVELEGIERVAGFIDGIQSDDAMWVSDSDSVPLSMSPVMVTGDESIDLGEAWSFGAEWNGNVARHVSYVLTSSFPGDGTADTVVLFNTAFDENAVDVRAADGKTHVVLVQGLEADSFAHVWDGVRYRGMRYERADTDDMTMVAFPSLSVRGSLLGDGMAGEEAEVLRLARAVVPVLRDGEVAGSAETARCGGLLALRRSKDGMVSRDGDGMGVASWDISFNDTFCMFVYEEPFDGYDVLWDFAKVSLPSVALLVTDIKLFQCGAERLTDYDPGWGKDTVL